MGYKINNVTNMRIRLKIILYPAYVLLLIICSGTQVSGKNSCSLLINSCYEVYDDSQLSIKPKHYGENIDSIKNPDIKKRFFLMELGGSNIWYSAGFGKRYFKKQFIFSGGFNVFYNQNWQTPNPSLFKMIFSPGLFIDYSLKWRKKWSKIVGVSTIIILDGYELFHKRSLPCKASPCYLFYGVNTSLNIGLLWKPKNNLDLAFRVFGIYISKPSNILLAVPGITFKSYF